jgi:galactose mutarotase-like enzyme
MTSTEEKDVLIKAGDFSLIVIPHLGGKIASIRIKDCELLQAPLAPYGPRTRTMPFDTGDASGWDECMPSVAACRVETTAGPASIPDHGDLWRVAWQPAASRSGSTTFRGECFSLPLALERMVTVTEVEKSWQLSLNYTVTNTGSYSVPWSWAAHPLFAVEVGDRILLPDSIHTLHLEASGGERLGKGGATVLWPVATLANGSKTDLSVAQPSKSRVGDKLFSGPLAAAENWCALERPSAGVRIRVRLDPVATPYLGLWICYGGWPDRPGPKQVCVALEPATAPVDSLARTGPWSRMLAPGESFSWPMSVDFEPIQRL